MNGLPANLIESARAAAYAGYGVEDLVVKYNLAPDFAKRIVWRAETERYAAKLKREAKF